MITEICREIRNCFAKDKETCKLYGIEKGDYSIKDNSLFIIKKKYITGQYIGIKDSFLNDGIYLVKNAEESKLMLDDKIQLYDEDFTGKIYTLKIPRDFIQLVEKIKTFNESDNAQNSNIISASFGIQSQTFATDKSGMKASWQNVFAKQLSKYRRMTADIEL